MWIFIIQHERRKSLAYRTEFALEVVDVMLTDEAVVDESKQELELFAELDKGIEDMEAGRVTPHDEAMKKIRESVGLYAV